MKRAVDAFPAIGGLGVTITFSSTQITITGTITETVEVDVTRSLSLTRMHVRDMPNQRAITCSREVTDLEPSEFLLVSRCGSPPCKCQFDFLIDSVEAQPEEENAGTEVFTFEDSAHPETNHTDTNPGNIHVSFFMEDMVVCNGQRPVNSSDDTCLDFVGSDPITPTVEVIQVGNATPGSERYGDQIIRLSPSGTHACYGGTLQMRVPSFSDISQTPPVVIPEEIVMFSLDGPLSTRINSEAFIVMLPSYALHITIDGLDGIRLQWVGLNPQPIPTIEYVVEDFVEPVVLNFDDASDIANRVNGSAGLEGLIYGAFSPVLDMVAELVDPCHGGIGFSATVIFDNQDTPDPDPNFQYSYEWTVTGALE